MRPNVGRGWQRRITAKGGESAKRRFAEHLLEPTLGIEPRTPSLRVAPDRARGAASASRQPHEVPLSPLSLTGMLARSLARGTSSRRAGLTRDDGRSGRPGGVLRRLCRATTRTRCPLPSQVAGLLPASVARGHVCRVSLVEAEAGAGSPRGTCALTRVGRRRFGTWAAGVHRESLAAPIRRASPHVPVVQRVPAVTVRGPRGCPRRVAESVGTPGRASRQPFTSMGRRSRLGRDPRK